MLSHGTSSASHTQKNTHCPTISVTSTSLWSHKLPSTQPHRVVTRAAAHVKVVSCCCAQSPQPLLVPLRISCCQGPRQAWPSLGHTAQAQSWPSRSPEPLCPVILAGPMGFPLSSPPVSAHCPTPRAPRPGFPRRGTCGQLGRSRLHCLTSLGQDLSWSRGSA